MHFYEGYHFWGMHLFWWFVWVVIFIWIFATPYEIPGKKRKPNSPLNILQNRFAEGSITKEEYEERKAILMKDGA
jgi:putative membrane protein